MSDHIKKKLIIALDLETADRALDLFEALRDVAGLFKVGSQLFTKAGPDVVRKIVAKGGRVFLDLKFHDIPNTVAAAAIEATRLGVSIFNVHAAGGSEMMKRTSAAVSETASREGLIPPKVIAVTLLTSFDEKQLVEIRANESLKDYVGALAQLTADSGLDGVVASPREIRVVRERVARPDFLIVTPGIRFNLGADDQKRVMSAADAVRAGADYLVVGRPILSAPDPAAAALKIIGEMASGLQN